MKETVVLKQNEIMSKRVQELRSRNSSSQSSEFFSPCGSFSQSLIDQQQRDQIRKNEGSKSCVVSSPLPIIDQTSRKDMTINSRDSFHSFRSNSDYVFSRDLNNNSIPNQEDSDMFKSIEGDNNLSQVSSNIESQNGNNQNDMGLTDKWKERGIIIDKLASKCKQLDKTYQKSNDDQTQSKFPSQKQDLGKRLLNINDTETYKTSSENANSYEPPQLPKDNMKVISIFGKLKNSIAIDLDSSLSRSNKSNMEESKANDRPSFQKKKQGSFDKSNTDRREGAESNSVSPNLRCIKRLSFAQYVPRQRIISEELEFGSVAEIELNLSQDINKRIEMDEFNQERMAYPITQLHEEKMENKERFLYFARSNGDKRKEYSRSPHVNRLICRQKQVGSSASVSDQAKRRRFTLNMTFLMSLVLEKDGGLKYAVYLNHLIGTIARGFVYFFLIVLSCKNMDHLKFFAPLILFSRVYYAISMLYVLFYFEQKSPSFRRVSLIFNSCFQLPIYSDRPLYSQMIDDMRSQHSLNHRLQRKAKLLFVLSPAELNFLSLPYLQEKKRWNIFYIANFIYQGIEAILLYPIIIIFSLIKEEDSLVIDIDFLLISRYIVSLSLILFFYFCLHLLIYANKHIKL